MLFFNAHIFINIFFHFFKMDEDLYQSGQEAFYHDMGEVDKVKILENNSDEINIKYKLKVLSVVKKSKIIKPSEIGEEFNCEKKRSTSSSGLWHLLDN